MAASGGLPAPTLSAPGKLSAGVCGREEARGGTGPAPRSPLPELPGQLLRGQARIFRRAARIFRGNGAAGVAGPGWQMITAIIGTLHAKGLTALCSP